MVTLFNAKVSVVIVSYNTKELTLKSLSHVFHDVKSLESAEVILVDNKSHDGTVDAVRKHYPDVTVIENTENVGFGRANNQAFHRCNGEYVLLINSDAFIHDGCTAKLCRYLDAHDEVAVVGPRVLNNNQTLQVSVHPFPSPLRCWIENLWLNQLVKGNFDLSDWRAWNHGKTQSVPWVIGACMLVRRSVIEQTQGFDEDYFMYAEETDWQYRIRKAGWDIHFVCDAVVTHLGGASEGTEVLSSNARRAFFESLFVFELKNFGKLGSFSARSAMLIGSLLRLCAWATIGVTLPKKRLVAIKKARHYWWLLCFLCTPQKKVVRHS